MRTSDVRARHLLVFALWSCAGGGPRLASLAREAAIDATLIDLAAAARGDDQAAMRKVEDGEGRFALAWLALKHASQKSQTLDELRDANVGLLWSFFLGVLVGAEVDPFIAVPVGQLGAALLVESGLAEKGQIQWLFPNVVTGVESAGEKPVVVQEEVAMIRYETVRQKLEASRARRLAELRQVGIERCRRGAVLGGFDPGAPDLRPILAPSTTAQRWAASAERIWAVRVDCDSRVGLFLFTAHRPDRSAPAREHRGYPALGWRFFSAAEWPEVESLTAKALEGR